MDDQLSKDNGPTEKDLGSPARRREMPRRHVLLACLSVVLAVAGVLVYVQAAPSLLPLPGDEASAPANDAQDDSGVEGDNDSGDNEEAPEDAEDASGESDAKDGADGQKDPETATAQGAASGEKDDEENPGSQDQGDKQDSSASESPSKDSGASDEPSTPSNPSMPSTPSTPNEQPPAADDVFANAPSAAEEQEFRAFLAGWLSQLHGYLSQANGVAGTFDATCLSGDLSARRANSGSCNALCQQLLSGYVTVRDRPRSNYSQYTGAQERLIGAYRCLYSYVACYSDAWSINVSFDDPSGHEGEFRSPLGPSAGYLSEFYSYYQGLSI